MKMMTRSHSVIKMFLLLAITLMLLSEARNTLTAQRPAQVGMWREIPELTSRIGHSMAYDPIRKNIVMFGGKIGERASDLVNDTWIWEGDRWIRMNPTRSPSSRWCHTLAFDPVRETIILFGGEDSIAKLNDTWEWDGRNWHLISTPQAPQPRDKHMMATDLKRGVIVLFGGLSSGGVINPGSLSDTWEWGGFSWREVFPSTVPLPRYAGEMAYSPDLDQMLMFGGQAGLSGSARPPETWLWDGSDWKQLIPTTNPPPNFSAGGFFPDPVRKTLILYGPYSYNYYPTNHMWEWNGMDWFQIFPQPAPPARVAARLAVEEHNNRVIMFGTDDAPVGGNRGSSGVITWCWDGAGWSRIFEWNQPDTTAYGNSPYYASPDLAYDSKRGFPFLFAYRTIGVESNTGRNLNLYRLVNDRWEPANPPVVPPQSVATRKGKFFIAYHETLDKVLLFNPRAQETWSLGLSSLNWSKESPPGAHPPFGQGTAMVYDIRKQKIVVLVDPYSGPSLETWEWDSSGWAKATPSLEVPRSSLGSFYSAPLAYDASRGRTVFVRSSNQIWEIWEWDGLNWSVINLPRSLPEYEGMYMVGYIPPLGGILFRHGRSITPFSPDYIVWDGNSFTDHPEQIPSVLATGVFDCQRQRFVGLLPRRAEIFDPINPSLTLELYFPRLTSSECYPRPGESINLSIDLLGQRGQVFVLGLSEGTFPGLPMIPSPFGLGVEVLPLNPGPLLNSSLALGMTGFLDQRGIGAMRLQIPNNPLLGGFNFYCAGFTLGSGGISAVTNEVPLRILR